jgi:molecular chaperone IbpA
MNMRHVDFSPLYRSVIGFDHLASLLDTAMNSEQKQPSYPPYNIELLGEDEYRITMAVAGFEHAELNIEVENGTLSVSGKKDAESNEKRYLHRGIATRNFQRRFQLADHVKVRDARLHNGMLNIDLVREIPEALKPRTIEIRSDEGQLLEGNASSKEDKKIQAA